MAHDERGFCGTLVLGDVKGAESSAARIPRPCFESGFRLWPGEQSVERQSRESVSFGLVCYRVEHADAFPTMLVI